MTDYNLLRVYFLNGFPSGERDDERPYVVAHLKKLPQQTWEKAVARISHPTYWGNAGKFGQARETADFLTAINRANPVVADPDNVQAEGDIMEAVEGTAAANAPYPASGHCSASSSSGVRHRDAPNQTEKTGRMATC